MKTQLITLFVSSNLTAEILTHTPPAPNKINRAKL